MEDEICGAIQNRQVIQFYYEQQLRIVEPFTLGYHKGTGNLVLSAYRVGGYSKSEKEPPWRLFIVDNIETMEVTSTIAQNSREGYNPNDSRMSEIICTV